jgi:hypothetical protein
MQVSLLKKKADSNYLRIKIIYYSLYIHGGRDLKEGALDSMWKLNLDDLEHLNLDPFYQAAWE